VGWGSVDFRGEGQAARGEEGADGSVHGWGAGRGDGGEGVIDKKAGAKACGGLDGVDDGEGSRVQVVRSRAQAKWVGQVVVDAAFEDLGDLPPAGGGDGEHAVRVAHVCSE
jgi:hypothetical protein